MTKAFHLNSKTHGDSIPQLHLAFEHFPVNLIENVP